MNIYDLESLLSDVESVLKSNLNTKLGELDTEKNDGITLKQLDTNAFFLQTMNDKNAVFNPFILYGVEENQPQPIGPATGHIYKIGIVLVLVDNGVDKFLIKKLFRYQRAIREVIQEHWADFGNGVRAKVSDIAPDLNSSEDYKVIGISLEAGFA